MARDSPHTRIETVGAGASAAWVLHPIGPPRVVVIFAHGWKTSPSPVGAAWVEQFRPWLDHLLGRHAAIVFPRYQTGGGTATASSLLANFLAGVRDALTSLGRPSLPVVAIGYSYGASLVMAYAGDAGQEGLPVPAAVDAIFPAAPLPGESAARVPAATRVLLQIGDADTEAGRGGADVFWQQLAGHPAASKRFAVVRSGPRLRAVHAAPKLATEAARADFWAPLDNLIATAEARP